MRILSYILPLFLLAFAAQATETITLPVKQTDFEKVWKAALVDKLRADKIGNVFSETRVDYGRVDITTDKEVIEVDRHDKFHQGIGQALYENIVYDEYGQLLSGSLMDYALPTAEMTPQFVTTTIETPSPTNPLGVKGMGEGPTTGAPPAVVNAVVDALRSFGVSDIDMPLTPERVWREIQDARTVNGDRR